MIARTVAALCAVAAAVSDVEASRRVGIVIARESPHADAVAASVVGWCSRHGFETDIAPIPANAMAALADCSLIGDEVCASSVIDQRAATAEVIYVKVQPLGDATRIDVRWFVRGATSIANTRTCASCDDARLQSTLDASLGGLAASMIGAPTTTSPAVITTPTLVSVAAAGGSVGRRGGEVATVRAWHVGLWLGAALPRRALDPGLLLGGGAALALDREGTWLVHVAVDWVRTGHDARTLLSPAWFPRSAGDLVDQADLVTLAAGGSVRLARVGSVSLRAGLAVGVQDSRARLTAYGISHAQSGIAPAATAELAIVGPAGPISWRGTIGWRESRRDLGAARAYAEETTSSGLVALGVDW